MMAKSEPDEGYITGLEMSIRKLPGNFAGERGSRYHTGHE